MDSIYEQWKRDFVASKVIKGDRNIGQLGCVIHKIANKVFQTGQAMDSFCFSENLILLILFFFWELIFLAILFTCMLARKETFPPSCIAAMLCWFFRRDACHRCCLSPWPVFFLASSHRFIHVSICSPSLWLGNYVQSSSVISCVVGLCSDVLSGLVGGLAGRQLSIRWVISPFFYLWL